MRPVKNNLFDFEDGNGLVEAHRHKKGGGWVANTAIIGPDVYLGPEARVFNTASVYGNCIINGQSRVCDAAVVEGEVSIHNHVEVSDSAHISGLIKLYDRVRVCGYADLGGSFSVYDRVNLSGDAQLCLGEGAYLHGEVKIDFTPVVIADLLEWPIIITRNKPKWVMVGCQSHPLSYFLKNARLFARAYGVSERDIRLATDIVGRIGKRSL